MFSINNKVKSVTAFAPATSANFAVGYDLLGFALSGVGDNVKLTKRDDNKIIITKISGAKGAEKLPFDAEKNVSSAVIIKFLKDYNLKIGFDIEIKKGITLGSGMGGSAASSVSALIALNGFLENPCPINELVNYAIYGESLITGAYHGDNAVPSMVGGMILLQNSEPCKMIELPSPDLQVIIICPELSIETKKAREILKEPYDLADIVKHSAHLATVISALYTNDIDLLGENLKDILIEPRRAHLIKGFYEVQNNALSNGAIACGISGSGPTMFALVKNNDNATNIAKSMQETFKKFNLNSNYWISNISKKGAYITEKELY